MNKILLQSESKGLVFAILFRIHRKNTVQIADIAGCARSTVARKMRPTLAKIDGMSPGESRVFRRWAASISQNDLLEIIRKPDPELWHRLGKKPPSTVA